MLSLILISLLNPLVISGKSLGMEMYPTNLMTKELNPSDLRSINMYESISPEHYQAPYKPSNQYSDRYSAEVEMEENYEPYKSCSKSEEYSAYNPYGGESCTQTAFPTDYSPYGHKSKAKVETLEEVLDDLASQKQTKPVKRPKNGKSNSTEKYGSYNSNNGYGYSDYYSKPKPAYQSEYSSEEYGDGALDYYKPSKPYQSEYSSEESSTNSYETDPSYNKPYKKPYGSSYGSEEQESSYGSNSYGKPSENPYQKPYDSTYSENEYENGYQSDNNESYYGKPPKRPYEMEFTEYSGKGTYSGHNHQ